MLRFSVIVPLYNKAPYVRKALESVMAQTFTDFELIVVDDGSTDNSVAICKEYIATIKRSVTINQSIIGNIRIISQPNAGVASARNNGVKSSRGEFLCFLDADDWWEPSFLEEMDKLITEYPDAGIYATNYVYYKPGKTRVMLDISTGYIDYPAEYLRTGAMPVTSITTCMPRRVFDEMGGFPIGIKLGEDFLLWAKTAVHYPVAFCEKALAYYNNDVPASLRATRNLHAPKYHMLFHLNPLLDEINRFQSTSNKSAWLQLIDTLRVSGLMSYWMDETYHDAAVKELGKVDWSKQPESQIRIYKTPIWILKLKRNIMRLGSYCKQRIMRLCKV